MADHAILIEKRDDAWQCALMHVHATGPAAFSHYRTIRTKTMEAAASTYRAQLSLDSDTPVAAIADKGPDHWTIVSLETARRLGQHWDGRGDVATGIDISFGHTVAIDGMTRMGELAFSPSFPGATRVYDRLLSANGFVCRDDVASYGGIVNVYEAVASIERVGAPALTAQDIIDHALADTNALCSRAVTYVIDAMAAIAGDCLLESRADGRVRLIGPLTDQLRRLIEPSRFETIALCKGPGAARLASIDFVWDAGSPSAFLGLAAAMAPRLQYKVPSPSPCNVDAMDTAWDGAASSRAWAVDRSLRLVHVANIPWHDMPGGQTDFRPGRAVEPVLVALQAKGLLPPGTLADGLLALFQQSGAFSFVRYGIGGAELICDAHPVAGAGFIVTERTAASVATITEGGLLIDQCAVPNDVLDLTTAEEVLDAAVALSPLVGDAQEPPPLTPRQILVLDRNVVGRMIMKTMLMQENADVVICATTEEALAYLQSTQIDVVVADVTVAASEVSALVRSAVRQQKRPLLIAMLHPADMQRKAEILSLGFDQCLPKPVSHVRLKTLMAQWFGDAVPRESTRALSIGG